MAHLVTKLASEFLGTFLLMLIIMASGGNFLMIGLALGVIVFLTGGISGASVNPAVSVGLWLSGTLSSTMLAGYILAEVLGAVAAVYSYKVVA